MEKCLEVMGKTIRAQTVDGVLNPTRLLSSKPIPSLSFSPKERITPHHIKIAHINSFPPLHLRVHALLTNRAESEEKILLLQENQQPPIPAGKLGGKGKHPCSPITSYYRSSPRLFHHMRYGMEDTQGMAAPALQP